MTCRSLSSLHHQLPAFTRIATNGIESFSTLDPAVLRSSPLLHGTSTDLRREVIKMFLETLHAASLHDVQLCMSVAAPPTNNNLGGHLRGGSPPAVSRTLPSPAEEIISDSRQFSTEALSEWLPEERPWVDSEAAAQEIPSTNETVRSDCIGREDESDKIVVPVHRPLEAAPSSRRTEKRKSPRPIEIRLERAIKQGDFDVAMNLFRTMQASKQTVRISLTLKLFFAIVPKDPFAAYQLLEYFNGHPAFREIHLGMYRKMCLVVATLDAHRMRRDRSTIHSFVGKFIGEVSRMSFEAKKDLYPLLITSLVIQKSVNIGKYASLLYKEMVESNFPMSQGWLIHLLSHSKYNRQEDIPYHDVLARLVGAGFLPYPPILFRAVDNMFPYTDSDASGVTLRAVLHLLRNQSEESLSSRREYFIDMGTLEAMSVAAARSGDSEAITMVWDVMDQLQYKPTETIYENTIIAFAVSGNLQNAFAAMGSMEAEGYFPSRALIRSFSLAIR